MTLSDSEITFAKKQIIAWEKFAKQWPWMRWVSLTLAIVLAGAAFYKLLSMEKIWDMGEQWPLINNAQYQSDVSGYINMRMALFRGEIALYVGALFQLAVSAIIFCGIFIGWSKHKYIKLKILALQALLERNQTKNS